MLCTAPCFLGNASRSTLCQIIKTLAAIPTPLSGLDSFCCITTIRDLGASLLIITPITFTSLEVQTYPSTFYKLIYSSLDWNTSSVLYLRTGGVICQNYAYAGFSRASVIHIQLSPANSHRKVHNQFVGLLVTLPSPIWCICSEGRVKARERFAGVEAEAQSDRASLRRV